MSFYSPRYYCDCYVLVLNYNHSLWDNTHDSLHYITYMTCVLAKLLPGFE